MSEEHTHILFILNEKPLSRETLKTFMPGQSTDRYVYPSKPTECSHSYFVIQNLNSDFTDSALGSTDKSALPFGDFRMRESTMQSILNNPKYGPRSELGTDKYLNA